MTCYDCAKPKGHEPDCPVVLEAKERRSAEVRFGHVKHEAPRIIRYDVPGCPFDSEEVRKKYGLIGGVE